MTVCLISFAEWYDLHHIINHEWINHESRRPSIHLQYPLPIRRSNDSWSSLVHSTLELAKETKKSGKIHRYMNKYPPTTSIIFSLLINYPAFILLAFFTLASINYLPYGRYYYMYQHYPYDIQSITLGNIKSIHTNNMINSYSTSKFGFLLNYPTKLAFIISANINTTYTNTTCIDLSEFIDTWTHTPRQRAPSAF